MRDKLSEVMHNRGYKISKLGPSRWFKYVGEEMWVVDLRTDMAITYRGGVIVDNTDALKRDFIQVKAELEEEQVKLW